MRSRGMCVSTLTCPSPHLFCLQGGSAAHAVLTGKDGVQSELDLGVGWQVSDRG